MEALRPAKRRRRTLYRPPRSLPGTPYTISSHGHRDQRGDRHHDADTPGEDFDPPNPVSQVDAAGEWLFNDPDAWMKFGWTNGPSTPGEQVQVDIQVEVTQGCIAFGQPRPNASLPEPREPTRWHNGTCIGPTRSTSASGRSTGERARTVRTNATARSSVIGRRGQTTGGWNTCEFRAPMSETRKPIPRADDPVSGTRVRSGQSGAMLVEVMLAVSLSALLLGGFLGWALISITQQQTVRADQRRHVRIGPRQRSVPPGRGQLVGCGQSTHDVTETVRNAGEHPRLCRRRGVRR